MAVGVERYGNQREVRVGIQVGKGDWRKIVLRKMKE